MRLWGRGAAVASALFRLAFRFFPRGHRELTEAEAVEAFKLGYRRRRTESGLACAWRYAGRSVVDAVAAGWRTRRRHRARTRQPPVARNPETGLLTDLGGDVRYAFRRMGRAPAFTAAVVLILALGVGVNAAVFSALKTALLEPPPYPSERLVFPSLTVQRSGTERSNWSYLDFRDFRQATGEAFDAIAGYASRSASWTAPGETAYVPYELVTPGYLELLGAVPAVGRFFVPEEEGATSSPAVAVLSHDTWQSRFGGDPSVVGRSITVDGVRVQVVGVAGAGFRGLTGEAAFWVPVGHARATLGSWAMGSRTSHWLHAVARLAPGVAAEGARARVAAVGRAIALADGPLEAGERLVVRVAPFREVWTNPATRTSIWLLAAAAGLVLLIAITNLASLLLARGRRESRETAVRLALGAGRARLLRQRLVESLVLALLAGAGGLLMAAWAAGGIRALWPDRLTAGAGADVRWIDPATLSVDLQVVGVGFAIATLAALVFALLPAALQDGGRLMTTLKRGPGTLGESGRRGTGRSWLLGGQLAFSVVLLVAAGLLGGTLLRLHGEQKGFDHEGLLVVGYTFAGRPANASAPALAAAHDAFRHRVEALPGARSVALGTSAPLSGHPVRTRVSGVVGGRAFGEEAQPEIGVHSVSDGYFTTLGIDLVRGRTFTEEEFRRAGPIAVINRAAARVLFSGEDPLGRRFRMGFSVEEGNPPWTVVGVVDDVLYSTPVEGVMPEAYVPYGVWPGQAYANLFVRAPDPAALLPGVREAMRAVDPDVPFWRTMTGAELRRRGVADTRVLAFVLALFAGLAVLLSAAGVWAVVAQAVAERRREIGLRMALGAEAVEVEGLMVRRGSLPLVVGGATGLAIAAVGSRYLTRLLFRTDAHDPLIFAGAAGVVTATWLLASWLPARAAARVDPIEALSSE